MDATEGPHRVFNLCDPFFLRPSYSVVVSWIWMGRRFQPRPWIYLPSPWRWLRSNNGSTPWGRVVQAPYAETKAVCGLLLRIRSVTFVMGHYLQWQYLFHGMPVAETWGLEQIFRLLSILTDVCDCLFRKVWWDVSSTGLDNDFVAHMASLAWFDLITYEHSLWHWL
jgi:hypothetical protein